ncbi:MAG TPA: hypothetical protein VKB88_43620 [Bryobacteraceae bacterium]|nr:hypothetical protein [Bryobacteraceae bacterium]
MFIRQIEWLSSLGRHRRSVQAKPPLRASRFRFLYGTFNAGKNKLPGGAPFARRRFPQPAVKVPWQVDAGADRTGLHHLILTNAT